MSVPAYCWYVVIGQAMLADATRLPASDLATSEDMGTSKDYPMIGLVSERTSYCGRYRCTSTAPRRQG